MRVGTGDFDPSQRRALEVAANGGNLVLEGPPGSGRTTVILEMAKRALSKGGSTWAPAMVLTPDRRRASSLDLALSSHLQGQFASGLKTQGSHRLVRSLDSYAYMVLSLWLVERDHPKERVALFSGAREDAWVKRFLDERAQAWSQHFSKQVLDSQLVRMEIRNIMARSGQAGLLPEDLAMLGAQLKVPFWELTAEAYGAYAGSGENAFSEDTAHVDSARIPLLAANLLRGWESRKSENGVHAVAPIPQQVLIDDLQDLPRSAEPLLMALSELGAQILFSWAPDQATASFRGGRAELGHSLANALRAQKVVLQHSYRLPSAVAEVGQQISKWLPVFETPAEQAAHKKKAAAIDGDVQTGKSTLKTDSQIGSGATVPDVSVDVVSSNSRRSAQIARIMRHHNLHGSIPYRDMAVIVRTASEVEPMRRSLARAQIPLSAGERPVVLSKIPICYALLSLIESGASNRAKDDLSTQEEEKQARELLNSPLVNADPLDVYRLLRDMRSRVASDQESFGLVQMLTLLGNPLVSQEIHHKNLQTLNRVRKAAQLWHLRAQAAKTSASEGLWLLWEAADRAESLKETALRGKDTGQIAEEQLDAVIALFRKADLWQQEQLENSDGADVSAGSFARQLLVEQIAADPLVPKGVSERGVSLLTAAQVAGREWQVVVIAGLQDGLWPSRYRSDISSLGRLENIFAEAVSRRWTPQNSIEPFLPDHQALAEPDMLQQSNDKLVDEARLLYTAIGRASKYLHFLVIENEDQVASGFLKRLEEVGVIPPILAGSPSNEAVGSGRVFDLESAVGKMRRTLLTEGADAETQVQAARALSLLAGEGVFGAEPKTWSATGSISTDASILDIGPLRLNPSGLEAATNCPLQWLFNTSKAGAQDLGEDPTEMSPALFGLIIHEVAEENPHGTTEELECALKSKWETIGLSTDSGWMQRSWEEALQMVRRLGHHFESFSGTVLTEEKIRFTVGETLVSGRADRIEIDGEGRARVVDIKTGRVPSGNKLPDNLQLLSYQLGVIEMGYESGGASLFALDAEKPNPWLNQYPITQKEAEERRREISDLAARLTTSRVQADSEKGNCRVCPFLTACPAHSESARTTE